MPDGSQHLQGVLDFIAKKYKAARPMKLLVEWILVDMENRCLTDSRKTTFKYRWSESTQIPTNKITNGLSSLPFYILGISPFIGFFTLIISFYIPWIPKSIKEEEDYYLRTGWINYLAGGSGKELIKLKGPQYVNEILKYGILFCLNIFILFYFFLHFSTHIFFN